MYNTEYYTRLYLYICIDIIIIIILTRLMVGRSVNKSTRPVRVRLSSRVRIFRWSVKRAAYRFHAAAARTDLINYRLPRAYTPLLSIMHIAHAHLSPAAA